MIAPIESPVATASLRTPFQTLPKTIGELLEALRKIDAWLEARKRAATDRAVLANMSERELLDIGLDRASANAVASGAWTRDYPF